MKDKVNSDRLSTKDIALRGTIIAVIVTIPSLTAFLISWYILDDLLQAAIIGGVIHFIAMGFSLKVSRKFLTKESKSDPDI